MDKQNCTLVHRTDLTPVYSPSTFRKIAGRFHGMNRFVFSQLPSKCRKYGTSILACSWTLGLVFGICSVASGSFGPVFQQAADLSPSFFSIISVLFLPLVISLLALFAGWRWVIFPLAFLKALSFAYVGWSILAAFGSAGWLIRLLLMFSDCTTVPLLWWFWNKALTLEFDALVPASFSAALTILGIGILDYGVISPFLVSLSL